MKHEKWALAHLKRLNGKRAVITGANSGIGFECARYMLLLGANVTLACRSIEKAETAKAALLAEFPGEAVCCETLDLASRTSIEDFAEKAVKRGEKIDILLNCAGVYYPREQQTADGFPCTVGVNYTGTVMLTEALLPLMPHDGRAVFTTSLVDRFGKKAARVLAVGEKEGYPEYARSKALLSAWVMRRATERTESEPAFVAAHPGITATSLLDPAKTSHNPLFSRIGHAFLFVFTHKKEKAALTCLMAAAGKVQNGDCVGPRGLFGISGYPHKTKFCRNVRRFAAQRDIMP